MLDLTDPLWNKLDDAHRDRDIPNLLSQLADTWDDDEANSLFWDCLCHQETCYGATYAAVPHLLKIAQPEINRHQRREISLFLGFVVLCAFDRRSADPRSPMQGPLQGLAQTVEAWDQKLDVYRGLVASLEDPNRPSSQYEQAELLPRWREVLATEPVNEGDLEKIQAIRNAFFHALPEIRALCQRAYQENLQDPAVLPYLLSGVAAADGLLDLGYLLNCGSEGGFACSSCGWQYEYALFADKVAIYADEQAPGVPHLRAAGADRGLQDYKDGAPTRSDGFMSPIGASDRVLDDRIKALLELANEAPDPRPALLLRNFLGSVVCSKCGAEAAIKGL